MYSGILNCKYTNRKLTILQNNSKIREIYLFRHGHSQANAERNRKILFPKFFSFIRNSFGLSITLKLIRFIDTIRGYNNNYPLADENIPLENLGKDQAELTGKILADKNIIPDLILSSDYLRTRQTTDGILNGFKIQTGKFLENRVLYSKLIIERSSGVEYGYPLSYYPVLFPDTNAMYQTTPKLDFRPPGGESIRDVRFNRIPELLNILQHLEFKTLFIIGHGVTNSTIVSLLTGEDIENIRIGTPNLGVYRFTSDGASDKWILDPNFKNGKTIDPSTPFSG